MIRVTLIEDHDLSRIGLKAALQQIDDIDVVGEAANGSQGLDVLARIPTDVAIVDIGLPDIDGIELTQRLKQQANDKTLSSMSDRSSLKVLILTMHRHQDSVLAAFAAGADSYSIKDISLDSLVDAIRQTYEGNAWIDPAIARVVLQQARKSQPTTASQESPNSSNFTTVIDAADPEHQEIINATPLTERELEVLELIVAGANNADIAAKLFVTVGTVKTHVRNILSKLCVDDRTQAAVRALRSGLVS